LLVFFNRLLPNLGSADKVNASVNEYTPKVNLRKAVFLIVLAIVLMGLAGWLLARENIHQMLQAVRNANHSLIALAIALYFLSVGVWAMRWQAALSFIGCRMSFGVRYLLLCATIFLNNITPVVRVGGDPLGRVYMMRKLSGVNYSSGMASVIGESIFVPLVTVSFLMAGLILRFGQGSVELTLILAVAWVLVTLGAVFGPRFFFKKRIATRGISGVAIRVLGWFGKRGSVRAIVKGIEAFYSSTYATMDKWQHALAIASLTLLIGALDVFRLYTIFVALGFGHPTLPMLLVASSLPFIVGLIPFLPGGLILYEGSLLSVFALFGVPLNLAMAATLIQRGISFVLSTMVGVGAFSYLGVKMAAKPEV
jgi:uncharacterized protein (TIRG00374 family)